MLRHARLRQRSQRSLRAVRKRRRTENKPTNNSLDNRRNRYDIHLVRPIVLHGIPFTTHESQGWLPFKLQLCISA
ncbi:hypothetical protein VTO42DRAFT_7135 [Malbranchea cinnamomea]